MTDDDLVKKLLKLVEDLGEGATASSAEYIEAAVEAAIRIEVLVKERVFHLSTLEHMGEAVERMKKAEDRVEELEAKLKKVFQFIEGDMVADCIETIDELYDSTLAEKMRLTIAQLKGD